MANSDSLEKLSLEEIQARLRHVDSDRAALQKALKQRRQQTRKHVVQEVKKLIQSMGHDVEDILTIVNNKKRTAKPDRAYTHYIDPENPENEYVRGVVPGWMKEQMKKQGLDPKDREHRRLFKDQRLQKKEGYEEDSTE